MGVTCNLTAYEVSGSINVANNTTNVYIKLTATTSGSSYNNYSPSGTITINGTTYSYSKNIPKTTTTTLYEATHTITHNSDGTKSIGISYSFNTGISAGTLTGSKTLTLSTVPRTSSVTCADGNIGSATTININRASSGFTHTLKYSFGGLSGTIATKTSNTSIGWTIPTSFYAKIPNAKSGQGTITCETYSGSTLVGTSSCTFNAVVLEASNKPTITATVVDVNETTKTLTGDANKLVKYFSSAKVTMTATAKSSATIKSQKVVCGGKSSTTAISTLNNVESGTFNISCTDSRGFSTSSTITKTIVNYIKLAMTSLTIERESSTSNTVKINCKGNYFNASFGSVANTLTLKWRYRLKGGNWSGYTSVTATKSGNTFTYTGTLGTNFDYQQAYEFEVAYADKLISNSKVVSVTAGKPLIDIWKDNVEVNGNTIANQFVGPLNGKASKADIAYMLESKGGRISNANVTHTYENNKAHVQLLQATSSMTANKPAKDGYILHFSWDNNGAWDNQISISNNSNYLQTRSCDNGAWGSWHTIFASKTLYDNSSGTTGTVTLSDSAANYLYLEIFFDGGDSKTSAKVYSPNGKKAGLIVPSIESNNINNYLNCKVVSISGTSISVTQYARSVLYASSNISQTSNSTKIYRVIGYK